MVTEEATDHLPFLPFPFLPTPEGGKAGRRGLTHNAVTLGTVPCRPLYTHASAAEGRGVTRKEVNIPRKHTALSQVFAGEGKRRLKPICGSECRGGADGRTRRTWGSMALDIHTGKGQVIRRDLSHVNEGNTCDSRERKRYKKRAFKEA